jgi:hypothetical protein
VDATTLGKLVEEHEGKTLPLVIWSAKYRNMRGKAMYPFVFQRIIDLLCQSYLLFHLEIGLETQTRTLLIHLHLYWG